MQVPSNAKTISKVLLEWLQLTSDINNELSERESKGWQGDLPNSKKPVPEDQFRLALLTQKITAWRDTGGCTCDVEPLMSVQKLLFQRSRHCKPSNKKVAEIYERGIPPGERQVQMLVNAHDTVFRMLAVAHSRETDSAESKGEIQPGYLGLIVDPLTGIVRRQGEKFKTEFLHLKPNTVELHTMLVALKAGAKGMSSQEWKRGYPVGFKWSGHKNVKSRLGKNVGLLQHLP